MDKIKELEGKIVKAREDLGKIFAEAGDDMDMSKVTAISGSSAEKVGTIRKMNDDLSAMSKQLEDLKGLDAAKKGNEEAQRKAREEARPPLPGSGHQGKQVGAQTFGGLFIKSAAFTRKGKDAVLDMSVKTLFETTAGWPPESLRTGRVVENAQRPVQVLDLFPMTETQMNSVVYMEETTFTSAAAEAAEGGTYAESALALTEKSSPVKKIATFLPVTDEQLEDVSQVQGYIDNRLRFMLMQRLDSQVLNGDGVGANLTGILNTAGIQTQAKGADPTPDAIHKAMTKIRVTGRALPDGLILHPNDWEEIRLLRTADGIYIWGSPSEAGPERVWGLPVAQSDALAEGTGLVGAFRAHSELAERRGIAVQVSNSHSTFFIEGKQAIRADVRVALQVYRPAAFATVTGI